MTRTPLRKVDLQPRPAPARRRLTLRQQEEALRMLEELINGERDALFFTSDGICLHEAIEGEDLYPFDNIA